jgi:hypothetical protein
MIGIVVLFCSAAALVLCCSAGALLQRPLVLSALLQRSLVRCHTTKREGKEGDPHLEAWEGVGEDTERSYSAKSV